MEQDAASEVAPPAAPPQEAEAGDSVVAAAARITYDSDSDTDSTEEGDDGPRPLPTGPPPPVPERNPDTEAPALPSPAQQSPPSAGFAGEAGSPAPGQPSSSPAEAQEGDVEEEDAAPRQRRSSLVVSFAKGVGNRLGLRQKGAPGSTASDAGGAPAEAGQAEAAPGGDAPRRRPSVSRPLPSLQTAEVPAGSPHSVHSDPGAEEGVDGDGQQSLQRTQSLPPARRKSILKSPGTPRSATHGRRISFADEGAGHLEHVAYVDNLHYSDMADHHQDDDDKCAIQ